MGIRDKPIAAGSPWQNSFAERLIGTIRRECVDIGRRVGIKAHLSGLVIPLRHPSQVVAPEESVRSCPAQGQAGVHAGAELTPKIAGNN